MRSTGEVMGIGTTFGLAFAKSQIAAGMRLPSAGCGVPVPGRPGQGGGARGGPDVLASSGSSWSATSGTAAFLESNGVPVATVVAKVGESGAVRRRGPHRLGQGPAGGEHPAGPGPARRRPAHPLRRPRPPGALSDHGGRGARRRPPGSADWQTHGLSVGEPPRGATAMRLSPSRGSTCAPAWGRCRLPNPVLTASGTAGHGAELAAYVDLAALGAVVVKSLAAPSLGPATRAPRVHETPAGHAQLRRAAGTGDRRPGCTTSSLPSNDRGARVVASIWGQPRRGLRAGRRAARRGAGRRGRRGQRQLSQPRRPQPDVRPLGAGHGRGRGGLGGVRVAAVGEAQPQRVRPRRHRGRRRSVPGPRRWCS